MASETATLDRSLFDQLKREGYPGLGIELHLFPTRGEADRNGVIVLSRISWQSHQPVGATKAIGYICYFDDKQLEISPYRRQIGPQSRYRNQAGNMVVPWDAVGAIRTFPEG